VSARKFEPGGTSSFSGRVVRHTQSRTEDGTWQLTLIVAGDGAIRRTWQRAAARARRLLAGNPPARYSMSDYDTQEG
jgi:hypothetical protein